MVIPAILTPLLANGLNLLASAVKTKGKEWIKEKTNIDIESTLSDTDLLKLKQLEIEHEEELLNISLEEKKLEAELEKAYLADTTNARQMQIAAYQQDDVFSKRFVLYFAVFWSLMTAVFIGAITFTTIPEANVRFADTILGFLLGTIVAQIINFFYGSSRSSQSKDGVIKEMAGRR